MGLIGLVGVFTQDFGRLTLEILEKDFLARYTERKINMEPKIYHSGKGETSTNSHFWASMLIFGGVSGNWSCVFFELNKPAFLKPHLLDLHFLLPQKHNLEHLRELQEFSHGARNWKIRTFHRQDYQYVGHRLAKSHLQRRQWRAGNDFECRNIQFAIQS